MTSIYRLSDHVSDAMSEPEWAAIVGKRAVFATFTGERLLGTVEAPIPAVSSGYPVIRMDDGTWGRCGDAIHLID